MLKFAPLLLLAISVALSAQQTVFDESAARHLLSRAGFGATAAEAQRLSAMGLEAAVKHLLDQAAQPAATPFEAKAFRIDRKEVAGMTREEREVVRRRVQREDLTQLREFTQWWFGAMQRGDSPLREKLVLFWHGYFTSSMRDVRDSKRMIQQNELFRREAAGSFRTLLTEITVDPAMLEYLDNDENRSGKPNENYAREVMELFTLGVGNYSEKDISEAARAFTGWRVNGDEVSLERRGADRGVKTVLGNTGRLDTADVLSLLLAQEAAPRHVATRLLRFFVGDVIPPGLHERISAKLRSADWQMAPVLHALFTDPEFYSDAVRGARILSPVEFIVGIAHRLGETPPATLMAASASLMGQTLFDPPDVKGWDGGEHWITSASLLHRNNWAGYLVEGVSMRKLLSDTESKGGKLSERSLLNALRGKEWKPAQRLLPAVKAAGVNSAEALVQHLCQQFLVVAPTTESAAELVAFVKRNGHFKEGTQLPPESFIRTLVHLILSLPEAQLG